MKIGYTWIYWFNILFPPNTDNLPCSNRPPWTSLDMCIYHNKGIYTSHHRYLVWTTIDKMHTSSTYHLKLNWSYFMCSHPMSHVFIYIPYPPGFPQSRGPKGLPIPLRLEQPRRLRLAFPGSCDLEWPPRPCRCRWDGREVRKKGMVDDHWGETNLW